MGDLGHHHFLSMSVDRSEILIKVFCWFVREVVVRTY
jgi:hypothetical protein